VHASTVSGDFHDLVQAALVKVGLRWSGVRDVAAGRAYARKAMVHAQLNWWRRRGTERRFLASARPPAALDDLAHGVVQRDSLWRALADLTPRQRAVIVLRFYEDLTEQATADVLGVPVGTVKSLNARALERLRASPALDMTEAP
jgi:RNA polymerase sigma-70 factor (sigma-E family)